MGKEDTAASPAPPLASGTPRRGQAGLDVLGMGWLISPRVWLQASRHSGVRDSSRGRTGLAFAAAAAGRALGLGDKEVSPPCAHAYRRPGPGDAGRRWDEPAAIDCRSHPHDTNSFGQQHNAWPRPPRRPPRVPAPSPAVWIRF